MTKKTATPVALIEELALFRFYQEEEIFRELNFEKLCSKIFSFNNYQSETLKVVAIVQHYLSRGSLKDLPKWIGLFLKSDAEKIFSELKEVIPLEKK